MDNSHNIERGGHPVVRTACSRWDCIPSHESCDFEHGLFHSRTTGVEGLKIMGWRSWDTHFREKKLYCVFHSSCPSPLIRFSQVRKARSGHIISPSIHPRGATPQERAERGQGPQYRPRTPWPGWRCAEFDAGCTLVRANLRSGTGLRSGGG